MVEEYQPIPYEQFIEKQDDPKFRKSAIMGAIRKNVRRVEEKLSPSEIKKYRRANLKAYYEFYERQGVGKKALTGKEDNIDLGGNSGICVASGNPVETLRELKEAIETGEMFGSKMETSTSKSMPEDVKYSRVAIKPSPNDPHEREFADYPYISAWEGETLENYDSMANEKIREKHIPITLGKGEKWGIFINTYSRLFRTKKVADYLIQKGYPFIVTSGRDSTHIFAYHEGKRKPEVEKQGGLEGKVTGIIRILGLILGLFLLSSGISNKIQLSPGQSPFNWSLWIGIGLLAIGLAFFGLWIWRKRKNQKK